MIAAVGLGLHPNISLATSAMSHPLGETQPFFEDQDKYASLIKRFRQLRDMLLIEFNESLPKTKIVLEKT